MSVLAPTTRTPPAGSELVLPANFWNNGEFKDQYDPKADHFTTLAEMFARDMAAPNARYYVSPDGSLALPALRTFQQGPGWRWSNAMQTYGFITAKPGSRVFVTNGSEIKTYSGLLGAGGAITDLKVFANRGGESVAVGPDGRVYVANGQVFVIGGRSSSSPTMRSTRRSREVLAGLPSACIARFGHRGRPSARGCTVAGIFRA